MTTNQSSQTFYITGGTLPPDATSYVERQADKDLLASLLAGEYCYVLNSRQMGKSSLCVRTIGRLKSAGVRTAFVDLTKLGGASLTAEQWYAGLSSLIGRELGLRSEFLAYWKEKAAEGAGALQRLFGAIEEIALPHTDSPLVIFFDEIDATRSLSFPTDEFFIAIRELYVERAVNPILNSLSFCLLGTAAPTDLIQDIRISPFNIGTRVEVSDFTALEAEPLAQGLISRGDAETQRDAAQERERGRAGEREKKLLDRIIYWTNGHPYLTQKLCQAVSEGFSVRTPKTEHRTPSLTPNAEHPQSVSVSVSDSETQTHQKIPPSVQTPNTEHRTPTLVDRLCSDLFLAHNARTTDNNLTFVRDRLLKTSDDLAALLELYRQVVVGRKVPDDETNPLTSLLKLSGIVRVEQGMLHVRNRIYAQVFDKAWVLTHMPDAELRRQRRAFRTGLALATTISGLVLTAVFGLAFVAGRNERRANENARRAERSERLAQANAIEASREARLAKQAKSEADASAMLANTKSHEAVVRAKEAHQNQLLADSRLTQAVAAGKRETAAHADALHSASRASESARSAKAQAHEAANQRDKFKRLFYIADMNLIPASYDQNDFERIQSLLDETRASPFRGFEWNYWNRICHEDLCTLRGHTDEITFVSPDAGTITTGSSDSTIRFWDVATGAEKHRFTVGGNAVPIAVSQNSKLVVTYDDGFTATIWDADTGRALSTLKGHSGITSAAFSGDGLRVVTGGSDLTTRIWDVATGRELLMFKNAALVEQVAFSPDCKRIATAGTDNDVNLWDAGTGANLLKLKGHLLPVTALAFSPNSTRIITGSLDSTARVWDASNGQQVLTLKDHPGSVFSAAFSPDGKRIVTGAHDHAVSVWDSSSGGKVLVLRGHSGRVSSVAFSPDGKRIVTGSVDKTVKVWDALGGKWAAFNDNCQPTAISTSSDGKRIITGDMDQTAKLWDTRSGRLLQLLKGHTGVVISVAFSRDGARVVTGSGDNTAKIWDASSGRVLLTLTGETERIASVAFSPDDKHIVTGSWGSARVWNSSTGATERTLKDKEVFNTVIYSPDGKRIVTGGAGGAATVWDAATGLQVMTLKGHSDSIASVDFSRDGKRIVTGSDDHTAKVWDSITGVCKLTLKGHSDKVTSAAFSPDGRRIVTSSMDRTARIWDVATDQEVLALRHRTPVLAAAFSSDGMRIVTASSEGLNVWDGEDLENSHVGKAPIH